MIVYHVVTERSMAVGQRIVFDEAQHSGVYQRVQAKRALVEAIYAQPEKYEGTALEHHTAVALRELALEEVRQADYPYYPSRLGCLYVSETQREAEQWAEYFAGLGRPTYSIVKLEAKGNVFRGDASKCFAGRPDREENLRLARAYWESGNCAEPQVREMLADGELTVLEIVKEINANVG